MKLIEAKAQSLDPNHVRDVLQDAMDEGFTSVIVFGFKDKIVNIKQSGSPNSLELMGALEAAKQHIWRSA
jgi:hypothetical protein